MRVPDHRPLRSRLTPQERTLRSVTATLRREHRGWTWPRQLRLGIFGGAYVAVQVPTEPPADQALVCDMVEALVDAAVRRGLLAPNLVGSGWIVRPGELVEDAEDRRWLWEVRRVVRDRWLPDPGLWIVTKTGGIDLHTGAVRSWTRPRR